MADEILKSLLTGGVQKLDPPGGIWDPSDPEGTARANLVRPAESVSLDPVSRMRRRVTARELSSNLIPTRELAVKVAVDDLAARYLHKHQTPQAALAHLDELKALGDHRAIVQREVLKRLGAGSKTSQVVINKDMYVQGLGKIKGMKGPSTEGITWRDPYTWSGKQGAPTSGFNDPGTISPLPHRAAVPKPTFEGAAMDPDIARNRRAFLAEDPVLGRGVGRDFLGKPVPAPGTRLGFTDPSDLKKSDALRAADLDAQMEALINSKGPLAPRRDLNTPSDSGWKVLPGREAEVAAHLKANSDWAARKATDVDELVAKLSKLAYEPAEVGGFVSTGIMKGKQAAKLIPRLRDAAGLFREGAPAKAMTIMEKAAPVIAKLLL